MGKLIIDISNPHEYEICIDLTPVVQEVITHLNLGKNYELSIAFIDDAEISEYYRHYFGYTKSTDVLSFESGEFNPENNCTHLGDILISYPFVSHQSEFLGNDLNSEIALMVIHGTLHLLGFTHEEEAKKIEMWNLQNKILNQLNIHITQLPE